VAFRRALAIAGLLVLGLTTTAPAQTVRAADLAASLGVNVHMEYTDSAYADAGATLAALKFLNMNLVRDAAPDPHNQGQASYGAMAQAGVRFDLFVNGGDISTALRGLTALEAQYPGAVHAIEGPNEINNHAAFSFAGLTDKHRAATAYQAALFAAVKASPTRSALATSRTSTPTRTAAAHPARGSPRTRTRPWRSRRESPSSILSSDTSPSLCEARSANAAKRG
jgi:hypothetical protein